MDFLGMMTAGTYTFAAVNAEFFKDMGLSVPYTDGLGGAALDAVDAPFAQVLVQGDRVNEFFQACRLLSSDAPPRAAAGLK